MKRHIALWILLLLPVFQSPLWAGTNDFEIASAFTSIHSDKNGDPIGQTIYLLGGYSSRWVLFQFIDGSVSDPVLVNAEYSGSKIKFKLPTSLKQFGSFAGTISKDTIIGTFSGDKSVVTFKRISQFATSP